MRNRIFLLMLVLALVSGCSRDNPVIPEGAQDPGQIASAMNVNPRIVPPNSIAYGRSYAEWSVIWWQWMFSAPVDKNPGLDTTGENIGWAQSGPVWFLAPNFGGVSERTGNIPAGKAIFLDLIAWESSQLEGYGSTLEELSAFSKMIIDGVENFSCEIDGVPVRDIQQYRTQSPGLWGITLPDNNVFQLFGIDAPAGYYYPAFADGYYLMIAPLPVGSHVLHWTGDIPMIGHSQDITFHLNIVGGGGGRTPSQN